MVRRALIKIRFVLFFLMLLLLVSLQHSSALAADSLCSLWIRSESPKEESAFRKYILEKSRLEFLFHMVRAVRLQSKTFTGARNEKLKKAKAQILTPPRSQRLSDDHLSGLKNYFWLSTFHPQCAGLPTSRQVQIAEEALVREYKLLQERYLDFLDGIEEWDSSDFIVRDRELSSPMKEAFDEWVVADYWSQHLAQGRTYTSLAFYGGGGTAYHPKTTIFDGVREGLLMFTRFDAPLRLRLEGYEQFRVLRDYVTYSPLSWSILEDYAFLQGLEEDLKRKEKAAREPLLLYFGKAE